MKIILDSNIIIAAFAAEGLCHALFELCVDQHEIIISEHILSEVSDNLKNKIKLPVHIIEEIIQYLNEAARKENPPGLTQNVCRDYTDDMILSLAEISGAEYIITGDDDLLILNTYKSTSIIKPRDFWEIARNRNE
jgi:putative PIN family toxin of toxin-antitoxin system